MWRHYGGAAVPGGGTSASTCSPGTRRWAPLAVQWRFTSAAIHAGSPSTSIRRKGHIAPDARPLPRSPHSLVAAARDPGRGDAAGQDERGRRRAAPAQQDVQGLADAQAAQGACGRG